MNKARPQGGEGRRNEGENRVRTTTSRLAPGLTPSIIPCSRREFHDYRLGTGPLWVIGRGGRILIRKSDGSFMNEGKRTFPLAVRSER